MIYMDMKKFFGDMKVQDRESILNAAVKCNDVEEIKELLEKYGFSVDFDIAREVYDYIHSDIEITDDLLEKIAGGRTSGTDTKPN